MPLSASVMVVAVTAGLLPRLRYEHTVIVGAGSFSLTVMLTVAGAGVACR
jgi:hypothetical protein